MYHVAILYPTRATLADALRRLLHAGIELDGAADHGVSETLYLRDPDGNGVAFTATGWKLNVRASPVVNLPCSHVNLISMRCLAKQNQFERRAQRSFAGAERGLECCSSGDGRNTSREISE